ncbi:MAG: hypothetical protein A3E79_07260 [Burkholderiales bacterium RIFCSPHIGHO2_12_FULL_61_11]|nr:MAG: hypothetical protein A3E79_07260 [Burkholderiales bacterium RIFCSPHIGHO2_12_FULL_61_11]
MTSKTPRPSQNLEAPANSPAQWNSLGSNLSRQQLGFVTESACAIFRSSEAMRKVQQEAAHQALEHYAAAARKLHGACQPADLLAIQSELLSFDLQEASQYWQKLMAAALQAQTEMVSTTSNMLNSEAGSGVKSALEAFQATLPMMANAFQVGRQSGSAERPHDA